MGKPPLVFTFLCLLFAALIMNCYCQEKKVYIVYMGEKQSTAGISGESMQYSLHCSMLETALESAVAAKEALIYSYGRSFKGFAAKLSDEEVARLREMEGVASILPNTMLQLHTTRSWDFIGLAAQSHVTNITANTEVNGGDAIIGILDSGIWPESESFSDKGFGPPPRKWKGKCITNQNFTCNNKIIGARYYYSPRYYANPENTKNDIVSPRDSDGHGTHVASIAAGREVAGASYYGLGEGVARGGDPNARIAVYKVCWSYGCGTADILAAFDDAIADGVDIISISFGVSGFMFMDDPVAIGSFHALKKGILTTTTAGNNNARGTVTNVAPWVLTVAASTIDRQFVSQLALGNGKTFMGIAINVLNLNQTGRTFPLIWGGDATNFSANAIPQTSRHCFPGELDSYKINGTIVLCETQVISEDLIAGGSMGAIMPYQTSDDPPKTFTFPTTLISHAEIAQVLDYIKSTKDPVATILVSETSKDAVAPYVPPFSSRGPNVITPDILKPDLIAPGLNILGAWSPISTSQENANTMMGIKYNIGSGTSMSCPHVAGAAAIVKVAHPNWSPAEIKSALMTTAFVMDPTKHENEREFAYGSGLLNPAKAIDPGLVFHTTEREYVSFLCKQGYNTTTLRKVTGDKRICRSTKRGRGWDLNHPSFSLAIEDGNMIMGNFYRTATNVGAPKSTYHVTIDVPDFVEVQVLPSTLSFTRVGEKKSFSVVVKGQNISQVPIISGSIAWKDGVHVVRSPLVIYTVLPSVFLNNPSSNYKPLGDFPLLPWV